MKNLFTLKSEKKIIMKKFVEGECERWREKQHTEEIPLRSICMKTRGSTPFTADAEQRREAAAPLRPTV